MVFGTDLETDAFIYSSCGVTLKKKHTKKLKAAKLGQGYVVCCNCHILCQSKEKIGYFFSKEQGTLLLANFSLRTKYMSKVLVPMKPT